jgi:hypothetical protein
LLAMLAAFVIVAGLLLPFLAPALIVSVWGDAATAVFSGIPVIAAVAYVLHTFVPPLARFHGRYGPLLHGIFRATYLILAGGYLQAGLTEPEAWPSWVPALALSGALVWWSQRRGTKAQRLSLLLLACTALPAVQFFVIGVRTFMPHPGGMLLTGGLALAVLAEVLRLRRAGAAPMVQRD